ncbi:predicted protein [Arabidopsis lyrata subsp. lyrata]|uniref:Predicted protein n=1 Tax=Arabidopsis lyrata subsp. lyrata TaxID=81972 RepID=D7MVI1_ARALL|nr:predicted protein [Arabidopsis lyrata subsp. lyrata]
MWHYLGLGFGLRSSPQVLRLHDEAGARQAFFPVLVCCGVSDKHGSGDPFSAGETLFSDLLVENIGDGSVKSLMAQPPRWTMWLWQKVLVDRFLGLMLLTDCLSHHPSLPAVSCLQRTGYEGCWYLEEFWVEGLKGQGLGNVLVILLGRGLDREGGRE